MCVMALLIYAILSLVGGPDHSRQSTNAIPPLTLLALLPGLLVVLPHRGIFSEVAFRICSLYLRIVLCIDTVTCEGLSARRSPLYPLVF